MPVLFYKQAYITRPSRKNRWFQVMLGNLIILIAVPIGVFGVFANVKKMLNGGEEHSQLGDEMAVPLDPIVVDPLA